MDIGFIGLAIGLTNGPPIGAQGLKGLRIGGGISESIADIPCMPRGFCIPGMPIIMAVWFCNGAETFLIIAGLFAFVSAEGVRKLLLVFLCTTDPHCSISFFLTSMTGM